MMEPRLTLRGLRVVQITALGISAKSFLVEHFRMLRETGVEVSLVCSDDAEGRAAAQSSGIGFVPVPISQTIAPFADILNVCRLWRVFRRLRPHVVHAHMAKAGLVGGLAAYLAGVPVRIYHNHGLAMLSSHGLRRQLLRAADWLTNRLATHALFCSQSTRVAGIEAGVVQAEKSRVLGHGTISGVDTERFAPDATGRSREEQRQAWGVGGDQVVVGFVGRLVAHKGIETLVNAWRQLEPAVQERACLVLLGGTAHSEPRMREIVRQAECEDIGLKTVGWVDDMVTSYSGMDLLVLPSWHEGFPYGILEAHCMGLPVVATRATGNVDAVEHEETGLLVPLNDPAALAEAMLRLIRSPQERHRYGLEGRRRVRAYFNQDEVLGNLLRYYEKEVMPCLRRVVGRSE